MGPEVHDTMAVDKLSVWMGGGIVEEVFNAWSDVGPSCCG